MSKFYTNSDYTYLCYLVENMYAQFLFENVELCSNLYSTVYVWCMYSITGNVFVDIEREVIIIAAGEHVLYQLLLQILSG